MLTRNFQKNFIIFEINKRKYPGEKGKINTNYGT